MHTHVTFARPEEPGAPVRQTVIVDHGEPVTTTLVAGQAFHHGLHLSFEGWAGETVAEDLVRFTSPEGVAGVDFPAQPDPSSPSFETTSVITSRAALTPAGPVFRLQGFDAAGNHTGTDYTPDVTVHGTVLFGWLLVGAGWEVQDDTQPGEEANSAVRLVKPGTGAIAA